MLQLHLKPGRERAVRRFHPWIFSGAVDRLSGNPAPGEVVAVYAADGSLLGRGFCNTNSQIICRMLTWREEPIDRPFFERKIAAAYRLRFRLLSLPQEVDWQGQPTDAFRVVNAEGDGLPGLIVDRYGDFLVMQISTAGMARWREEVAAGLQNVLKPQGIYERSTGAALREEGLEPLARVALGAEPPPLIRIRENGLRFEVNVREGQKTGFFLDQRENRRWAAAFCRDRNVLNGFCYTGAFSVYAAAAGARRVVSVDSSSSAVALAQENFALNHLPVNPEDFVAADLFHYLRATILPFDFIILDPPAFAHRQKEVESAARAYKDVNLQAMKVIQPGGMLFTCSCSQPVSSDLFQKILFAAAADAGRPVRILGHSSHPPDHPINLYHPEGRYLQAWLLHVA